MKRLMAVLAVFLFFATFSVANAATENVVTLPDGSVTVAVKQEKVVFGPRALDTGAAWKKAYANPGKIIPIGSVHKKRVRDGLLHWKVWSVGERGIVYSNASGIRVLHQPVQLAEQREIDPYLPMWVVTWLLLVASAFLALRETTLALMLTWFVFAAFFLTVAGLVGIAAATSISTNVAAAVAAVAAVAIVAVTFVGDGHEEPPKSEFGWLGVWLLAYVIAMFASLGLWLAN